MAGTRINLSANDLSFALDTAIATLDGLHADEIEELYGDTMTPEDIDALRMRLSAAYGTIVEE